MQQGRQRHLLHSRLQQLKCCSLSRWAQADHVKNEAECPPVSLWDIGVTTNPAEGAGAEHQKACLSVSALLMQPVTSFPSGNAACGSSTASFARFLSATRAVRPFARITKTLELLCDAT